MICPVCGASEVCYTGVFAGQPDIGTVLWHSPNFPCHNGFYTICEDRVYLLNCLDGMAKMRAESVDLIVSDPPYLIEYKTRHRKDRNHDFCTAIQGDHDPDLIRNYLRGCNRILKPDSAAYIFCSAKTVDQFEKMAVSAGFSVKNRIVWNKGTWTMGDLKTSFGQQYEIILLLNKGSAPLQGKRTGDIWAFPRVSNKQMLHQNQKPVDLIMRCIEMHSGVGDLVFDGFMGSGTTAVAAMRTGRRFIGFEIEPRYFWIINNRICAEASACDTTETSGE